MNAVGFVVLLIIVAAPIAFITLAIRYAAKKTWFYVFLALVALVAAWAWSPRNVSGGVFEVVEYLQNALQITADEGCRHKIQFLCDNKWPEHF